MVIFKTHYKESKMKEKHFKGVNENNMVLVLLFLSFLLYGHLTFFSNEKIIVIVQDTKSTKP